MEVACQNCGTKVSSDAVMCYACGAKVDPNPYRLSDDLLIENNMAEAAMDRADWSAARVHFQKILERRPDISHFWMRVGLTYARQNNIGEHWNSLYRAIEAEPNNPNPWQARLELACGAARDQLQYHIEAYFKQFGQGEEQYLRLGESIMSVSPRDIGLAIKYLELAANANPKNRQAKSSLKKAMKIQKKAR